MAIGNKTTGRTIALYLSVCLRVGEFTFAIQYTSTENLWNVRFALVMLKRNDAHPVVWSDDGRSFKMVSFFVGFATWLEYWESLVLNRFVAS